MGRGRKTPAWADRRTWVVAPTARCNSLPAAEEITAEDVRQQGLEVWGTCKACWKPFMARPFRWSAEVRARTIFALFNEGLLKCPTCKAPFGTLKIQWPVPQLQCGQEIAEWPRSPDAVTP